MAKSSEEIEYQYGADITYQSEPDYDSFGIDDYWTCNDWMIWHTRLKAEYGLTTANEMWITAWDKQDSWESNYNWCKYNCDFYAFTKKNGIDVSHLLSRTICGVVNITDDVADGISGGAKVVKVAIPIAVIGVAIFYGFKAYKLLKGGR